MPLSSRFGYVDAQAKSVEFSSVSCFQRDFALGTTISKAIKITPTRKKPFLG